MPSELEPVPLGVLAEHIRDQTWLDMRVIEVGTCQRVQITQLNICRERDEVVVRQKHAVDDDALATDTLTFDAEDIRWVRETEVALADVTPVSIAVRVPSLTRAAVGPGAAAAMPHASDERVIVGRAVLIVSEHTGFSHTEIGRFCGWEEDYSIARARHLAIWLIYEMTDLPATVICEAFGYVSTTPLSSASDKARNAAFRADLEAIAEKLKKELLKTIGRVPRRSKPLNADPRWTLYL